MERDNGTGGTENGIKGSDHRAVTSAFMVYFHLQRIVPRICTPSAESVSRWRSMESLPARRGPDRDGQRSKERLDDDETCGGVLRYSRFVDKFVTGIERKPTERGKRYSFTANSVSIILNRFREPRAAGVTDSIGYFC